MKKDVVVVIPAAGQGKRMAAGQNKLFLPLGGKTILQHTLDLFINHPHIIHIYLVIAENDHELMIPYVGSSEKVISVSGGKERQDSVYHALKVIKQKEVQPCRVLVHDGARPFCSTSLLTKVLEKCELMKAVIPVVQLTDTIRKITSEQTEVIDRSKLFATQTPQGFEMNLLMEAYEMSKKKKWQVTDDASIVEQFGHPVSTVEGSFENIKITTPWDLKMGEWLLSRNESVSK